MGVIQRQGFKSGVWMYIGVLLGFLNGMILYPRILGVEVYGFIQWLFPLAMVIASFSSLGVKWGLLRYFPYFKSKEEGNQGILGLSLLIAHIGLLVTIIAFYFGQDWFVEYFRAPKNEKYIDSNAWLLPVLLVLMVYFDTLTTYLTALLRPSIIMFFKDFLARVLTTGLILCYYFGWINEEQFIALVVFKQVVLIIGVYFYVKAMDEWHLHIRWGAFSSTKLKEIGQYNLYNIMSGVGSQLINRIDTMMIPAFLSFGANGIYSIYYFITTLVIMPYEAVRQIATPLIAEAWKENDIPSIEDLYKRTARGTLAIAILVYIGIVANLDNAIQLIGEDIAPAKMVAVWLGIGQLIHCLNGYNTTILSLSERFRWDLPVKLFAVALTFTSNYIMIHKMGLVGAAIATASTIILTNMVYQGLIWRYFKLHPFSWQMPVLLGLGGAVLWLQQWLPLDNVHFIVDIIVRSICITVAYVGGVWSLKLVPELKDAVNKLPFMKT